jgi:N6-adenosine-specific RNA methylase IME4
MPSAQSVTVSPKFKNLIPPLADDELSKLEASILNDGCRDALVLWDGVLLDGHNRYAICQKHDLPFKTTSLKFPDELDAMIWIRTNQLARRNLTDDQRAMNAAELTALLGKQAMRDRASEAGKAGGKNHPKDLSLQTTPTCKLRKRKTTSRKKAAKASGVSERKVRQAQFVIAHDPALAKAVTAGEESLSDAVRAIKKRTHVAALENIATKQAKALLGEYDVVVIDPPWPMKKIERDERPNQSEFDYPTMDESALTAFKIPADKNCHLWLWTTHKFLPMAFRLLDAWNFAYVCTFVWHKPGGFQPIGLPQYNCEFALYARRGTPAFIDTKAFPVCFTAARGKHSEKPEEFYDVVRRVTAGRRIDIFNRRPIHGFDTWGNEATTP